MFSTSKSPILAKDSPRPYKGQIKDRSRVRVKKELPNNDISLFGRTMSVCLLQNRYFFQVNFFEISEVGES